MNVEEWTDEAGAAIAVHRRTATNRERNELPQISEAGWANDGHKKSRVIVTRGETPC